MNSKFCKVFFTECLIYSSKVHPYWANIAHLANFIKMFADCDRKIKSDFKTSLIYLFYLPITPSHHHIN